MTHGLDTGFLVAAEVAEHSDHEAARQQLHALREAGDRFALTAQVLAEFVHIVSDPKRFAAPLTMEAALERAQLWWESPEVDQLGTDAFSVGTFFTWMRQHRLGRKRILDTMLAATFHEAGIQSVLTTNSRDFTVLGHFVCLTP